MKTTHHALQKLATLRLLLSSATNFGDFSEFVSVELNTC